MGTEATSTYLHQGSNLDDVLHEMLISISTYLHKGSNPPPLVNNVLKGICSYTDMFTYIDMWKHATFRQLQHGQASGMQRTWCIFWLF